MTDIVKVRKRRAHKKSRNGCSNCKLRGVKVGIPFSNLSGDMRLTSLSVMRLCQTATGVVRLGWHATIAVLLRRWSRLLAEQ